MGPLFSYALSAAVYFIAGYLVYKIFLSGARQHVFNRLAIHAITIFAIIMPVASRQLSTLLSTSSPAVVDVAGVTAFEMDFELIPGGMIEEPSTPWMQIAIAVYVAGMGAAALWFLFGIANVWRIMGNGEKYELDLDGESYTLILVDNPDIAPFSWLGNIVMSRTDYMADSIAILRHEAAHIRHAHSGDVLAYMPVIVFQWFNPAAWLLMQELRSVHEYQADEAVMYSGADIRQYQMMLIKKAVGTKFQSPANSLNHSNLKNRITMMYQKQSGRARKAALLMAIPAMAVAVCVNSIPAVAGMLRDVSDSTLLPVSGDKVNEISAQMDIPMSEISYSESANETSETVRTVSESEKPVTASASISEESRNTEPEPTVTSAVKTAAEIPAAKAQDDKEVFVSVDQMAQFPGGPSAMMKYLYENIRYPEAAQKADIQGMVIVRFVIEKDGKIGDVIVAKGVDPEIDAEAIRVIKGMPAWTPGRNGGEPVASYYNIPVKFKIKESEPEKKEE